MKQAILLAVVFLALLSCRKNGTNDNRPYSTWYVNGQKISTNNVFYTRSMAASGFNGYDDQTKASFYFFYTNNTGPGWLSGQAYCEFGWNGRTYRSPHDAPFYVRGGMVGDKDALMIDTALVYEYADTSARKTDSVLVWGTFVYP